MVCCWFLLNTTNIKCVHRAWDSGTFVLFFLCYFGFFYGSCWIFPAQKAYRVFFIFVQILQFYIEHRDDPVGHNLRECRTLLNLHITQGESPNRSMLLAQSLLSLTHITKQTRHVWHFPHWTMRSKHRTFSASHPRSTKCTTLPAPDRRNARPSSTKWNPSRTQCIHPILWHPALQFA